MYIKLKILDYTLLIFPSSYFGVFSFCSVPQTTPMYFGTRIAPFLIVEKTCCVSLKLLWHWRLLLRLVF